MPLGTLRLLEAIRILGTEGTRAGSTKASTSELFTGWCRKRSQTEAHDRSYPRSPYGVAKL